MKVFKIILSLLVTVSLVYALNRNWGQVPPLGKFLDPFQGFWQNGERGLPADEELAFADLKGKVTVIYDSLLIPHIFADNEADLFFAQGYITAKHRLWQMEFQTLAAAGRLSEIVGEAALDYDRGQRRAGMSYGAENNLKSIEGDSLLNAVVTSYTQGVNAYLRSLSYATLPIEYKLLDYEPEPWTPLKAGLVQMNLSQTLNSGEKDLQFTNALKAFGKETFDLLYPDYEGVGDPVVTNTGNWKFQPITFDTVALAVPDEYIKLDPGEGKPRGIGSNNWVLNGTKTATGSPIVCNDPHLQLGMPSLWFVVHLNAPTVNTMGGSLAGAPAVILGFNDSIAWGCTNAQRDLVDWYRIQFKDAAKKEYLSDGRWLPTRKVVEKIGVRGGNAFYDTVVYTHHGPVRFDESYHSESERKHFAYKWLSHEGSEPAKAFYLLNHAKNHDDYMKALDHHAGPAQNFVFGSVSGDIAMRVQGKYPVRRKNEGKFVLDGTKTSTEWKAFIPNEQNVMIKNPSTGFLFSANQYPVDASYPYYIQSGDYYEAYRNRRIAQVLSQAANVKPEDMMTLHNDNYNLQAAESLPFMIQQLSESELTATEKEVVALLRGWDFFNAAQSQEAIYYESWWNNLYYTLWDEMRKAQVQMSMPSEFNTIKLLKEKIDLPFVDVQETPEKETLNALVRKSLAAAITEIETWKKENAGKSFDWASYKDTYVQHLLRLPSFGIHTRNGGNSGIVNASSHRWGPSWRMIVSLEKTGVQAWGVYPGGQSGNPGSRFYDNLITAWENSTPRKLKFVRAPNQLSGSTLTVTTLTPTPK